MIKIDLLKKRKSRGTIGVDFSKINIRMVIIALVFFWGLDYLCGTYWTGIEKSLDGNILEVTARNQALDEQIKENEKIKQEVENYKAQIVVLEERSKLVDSIVQQRRNPRDLLERLARDTTNDLWFVSLKIEDMLSQDSKSPPIPMIEIRGNANSYKSIGDFIIKANESRFFGNSLKLKDSQTITENNPSPRRLEAYTIDGKIAAY